MRKIKENLPLKDQDQRTDILDNVIMRKIIENLPLKDQDHDLKTDIHLKDNALSAASKSAVNQEKKESQEDTLETHPLAVTDHRENPGTLKDHQGQRTDTHHAIVREVNEEANEITTEEEIEDQQETRKTFSSC
jgi:hypothetical protein